MAGIEYTQTYDAFLSTTLWNYRKVLEDNIFQDLVLLWWLNEKGRKKVKTDGGALIVQPLMYGKNSTAGSYDGYDLLDVTPQEGITNAFYNWKQSSVSITISGKEERLNKGKSKLLGLLQTKIEQAEMSMSDDMNDQFYADGTGNSSKDALGLKAIVDHTPSSGTLAGIDRSVYTWWQNQQADCGAYGTYLLAKMRNLYNLCSKGRVHPDLVLASQVAFEYYEDLCEGKVQILTPLDQKAGDIGFQVLKFKGASMVWDTALAQGSPITGDTMYFLNSQFMYLCVDSDSDMTTTPFVRPANQDAKTAQVLWMGNLTSGNCRHLGVLHGIDAS